MSLIWYTTRKGITLLEVLFLLVVVGILLGLLLPATQAARETARRMSAMNELRQLDSAFAEEQMATGQNASPTPTRLRQWFPETLLWTPELITDDAGTASLNLELADSITTWRLSATAVTSTGSLGAEETSIRVFQPFFVDLNLPVALTRGDEVTVPAVVYNYLDTAQTVQLTLADAEWFEHLGDAQQKVTLEPREVRSVGFAIRAGKIGQFRLRVDAQADDIADAVQREIEVVSDGQRVEQVSNGTLRPEATVGWSLPEGAIPGSEKVILRIYPSTFSEVLGGMDAIFRQPYGCFEQTSSTTYPNVLALDYLRTTKSSNPEIELKARQYIHLGYQRLLGFEVAGGGFDWFGNPPADVTLTAYGLMELLDMARVHDVDPELIRRTRQWLMQQRQPDGSWQASRRFGSGNGRLDILNTTAYVAWSVFAGQQNSAGWDATRSFLLQHEPATIDDPYTLALVANALLALPDSRQAARHYIDRLIDLRQSSSDGVFVWWNRTGGARTMFYGGGSSADVETTALAALALIETGGHPETTRQALTWLVAQKDGRGLWPSTQATVLALKALLAGTGKPLGGHQPRRVEVVVDGKSVHTVEVPADQADLMRQVDLTAFVPEGKHQITLRDRSETAVGYQLVLSYHTPEPTAPPSDTDGPLSIDIRYDKARISVDDMVAVTATVTNRRDSVMPMVILDLPIPAGFETDRSAFDQLVSERIIAKYQLTPRSIIVYLRAIPSRAPLVIRYQLHATMPVKVQAQPARAYEYYDPDIHARSGSAQLEVL